MTTSQGEACVRCSYKANDGFLYFLNKAMFFVRKPTIFIRHDEIASVRFKRVGNQDTRSFDMELIIKKESAVLVNNLSSTANALVRESLEFNSIEYAEYEHLIKYLGAKGINYVTEREVSHGIYIQTYTLIEIIYYYIMVHIALAFHLFITSPLN